MNTILLTTTNPLGLIFCVVLISILELIGKKVWPNEETTN